MRDQIKVEIMLGFNTDYKEMTSSKADSMQLEKNEMKMLQLRL